MSEASRQAEASRQKRLLDVAQLRTKLLEAHDEIKALKVRALSKSPLPKIGDDKV